MKTQRIIFFTIFFSLTSFLVFSFGVKESSENKVTIYAYDSFSADWAAGPILAKMFYEKTGIKAEIISCGEASQVLTRAVLEKKKPLADVLIGIDNNLLPKAIEANVLEPYKSPNAENIIPKELQFSKDWYLTAYDWSYFAIIYDTKSKIEPPKNLEDLCDKRFEKQLILMDPRTSTPGLGFLAWTMAVYDTSWPTFWKRLSPSILTFAPSWSTGYGLFTSGEAPLVVSYTTSPAYHLEHENSTRYKVLIFESGHVSQIEGMGIVKNAKNKLAAQAFIDFMLTNEAQEVIPLTQWMYPVSKTASLPKSYNIATKPAKHLFVEIDNPTDAAENLFTVLAK